MDYDKCTKRGNKYTGQLNSNNRRTNIYTLFIKLIAYTCIMFNTQKTTMGPITESRSWVNKGKFVYEIFYARNQIRGKDCCIFDLILHASLLIPTVP